MKIWGVQKGRRILGIFTWPAVAPAQGLTHTESRSVNGVFVLRQLKKWHHHDHLKA